MQYASSLQFFSPACEKIVDMKPPGIVLPMPDPPRAHIPTETPREFRAWPSSDSRSVSGADSSSNGSSGMFNSGPTIFGAASDPEPRSFRVKQEFVHPSRHQLHHLHGNGQAAQSGFGYRSDAGARDVGGGTNWMWGDHDDELQELPMDTPHSYSEFGGATASDSHGSCLEANWVTPELEPAIAPYPTAMSSATPLGGIQSHAQDSIQEGDFFPGAFDNVAGMPMCTTISTSSATSPAQMENFVPFLMPCESDLVVDADSDSLLRLGAWESRQPCQDNIALGDSFAGQVNLIPLDGPKHSAVLASAALSEVSVGLSPAFSTVEAANGSAAHHAEVIPKSYGMLPVSRPGSSSKNSGALTMLNHMDRIVAEHGEASAYASPKRVLRSASRGKTRDDAVSYKSEPTVTALSPLPSARLSASQEYQGDDQNCRAQVQLLTPLNSCYWKNGRKNLQCFPACPEHADFYSMKMNNRKHSSVGVCRGPVYCHVYTAAVAPGAGGPSSSTTSSANACPTSSSVASTGPARHMKYELGVGASSSGGGSQELFVLGRFERVPQQQESSTLLLSQLTTPPQFETSAAFEQFRYSCFQAVEMEERRTHVTAPGTDNAGQCGAAIGSTQMQVQTGSTDLSLSSASPTMRSTWFFLPDVWKVRPMLKKKRKATRSAPAQTFPFCFRIFVYARVQSTTSDTSPPKFECLAATASTLFELYSTRTVDRVKRRVWGTARGDDPHDEGSTLASKRRRA